MPQDAEGEAARGGLQGFQRPVRSTRGFAQPRPQRAEALMVMRLHVVAIPQDRRQPRSGDHSHVVLGEHAGHLAMQLRPDTVRHMLLQVAAEGDVQHL